MTEDKRPQKASEEIVGESKPAEGTPARRKLIKHLAIGGGIMAGSGMLPEKWTRPVVDSVVLPAHGQTSPPNGGGDETCEGQVTALRIRNDTGGDKDNVTLEYTCPAGGSQTETIGEVLDGNAFNVEGDSSCTQNKFGNDLTLKVGGVCEAVFHTSCSVPIGPGTSCGGWTIVSGEASGSGELGEQSSSSAGCINCP